MAENRIYAYCRVSKNDGSMTIDNQVHAIDKWAEEHNIKISAYYKDECKGDTPINKRSQLPVMLENLRDGDTVVVVEVFRLYRSLSGLERVYRTIVEDKKAEFITLNEREQILNTANASNDIMQMSMKSMVLVMLSLFSELEKRNISTRTKRALDERKSRGIKLGRPTTEVPENFKELFVSASKGERTHASVMAMLDMKKATYYKLAKSLGLNSNKKIVGQN